MVLHDTSHTRLVTYIWIIYINLLPISLSITHLLYNNYISEKFILVESEININNDKLNKKQNLLQKVIYLPYR